MGQCCGPQQEPINVLHVIKVQALVRRWLSRRQLTVNRKNFLHQVASTHHPQHFTNFYSFKPEFCTKNLSFFVAVQ